MAMKPIPSVTPVVATESSGIIEQTENKINCIFTYGNNPENGGANTDVDADHSQAEFCYLQEKIDNGETLSDIERERYDELCMLYCESNDLEMTVDENRQETDGINSELFSESSDIYNSVTEAHPELDPDNPEDSNKIKEYCRMEKAKNIIAKLGLDVDVSSLSEDELTALSYTYDTIYRGAQLGMKERGIESFEEYYNSLTLDEIEAYEVEARDLLREKAPNSALVSSGRRNTIEAIDANAAQQKYYEDLLAFYNSGKVEGISDTNIKDVETLKQSKDFANIEYQYLKAKGNLTDTEKKRLAGYEKALETLHDLTGYRLPSDGDGSYLAEFNNPQYRTENIAKNGEKADEKMKEDIKNKLKADLESLPPDKRREKILEIIGTAKDSDESALLIQALIELQKENKDLISPDVLYGALKDLGEEYIVAVATLVFQSDNKELQAIVARDLAEKMKNDELPLTAVQFEALWQTFDDNIRNLFNESCGDKVTELLAKAEREIAERNAAKGSNNNDATSGKADDTGETPDRSHSAGGYIEHTPTENRNPFAQPSGQFDATDDEQLIIPTKFPGLKQSLFRTPNSSFSDNVTDNELQSPAQIKEQILKCDNPSQRAELFAKLTNDDDVIEVVMINPEKYIYDIQRDQRLLSKALGEMLHSSSGNWSLRKVYNKIVKEIQNKKEAV